MDGVNLLSEINRQTTPMTCFPVMGIGFMILDFSQAAGFGCLVYRNSTIGVIGR